VRLAQVIQHLIERRVGVLSLLAEADARLAGEELFGGVRSPQQQPRILQLEAARHRLLLLRQRHRDDLELRAQLMV